MLFAGLAALSTAFIGPAVPLFGRSGIHRIQAVDSGVMSNQLYDPSARDATYGTGDEANLAKYLVDLHDQKATFDFCGGMMFQLILSDKLRAHLAEVAHVGGEGAPVAFDPSKRRMCDVAGYRQSADADNVRFFHGREVRKVPHASGGMGFAIHLSSHVDDPEGWTANEVAGYDGWGHDSGRVWRNGEMLEREGFEGFRSKFGKEAFTLHHRFYLHYDSANRLWLSAEDGCEGHPAAGPERRRFGLF